VAHGAQHVVGAAGVLALPLPHHRSDLHTLQVVLAAAQRARDDRELPMSRPAFQVGLSHIGQRADYDVAPVVAGQLGRHALQAAAEEHVHQQRHHHVVAVVAECDLGGTEFRSHPIEDAAAQARAKAAHRLALGHQLLDDRVGVLVLDVEGHAARAQVLRQHVFGEAGLLLVEVDGNQLEVHRRALAHRDQQVEQRMAVLAAGQADHDPVAGFDHVEVGNRAAQFAMQLLAQLVGLEGLTARVARGGGGGGQVGDGVHFEAQAISRRRPKTSMPTASQSG